MNRNFAKIVDGRVQFAPDVLEDFPVEFPPLDEGGEPRIVPCSVANPSPDKLRAAGYLDVVTSLRPVDGDGYYYVAGYELVDDHLAQIWERRELEPPEPTIEDGLRILLGGATNA